MKTLTSLLILAAAAAFAADEADPAFFIVNGKPLKSSFVKDTVLITAKVMEFSGNKIGDKQFPRWGNICAMKIAPGLLNGMLVDDEMDRLGLKATPESDSATLARYNRLTKSNAANLDELAPKFGELEGAFRRQFAHESRLKAFLDSNKAEEVTERDLEWFYRRATNRLEKCQRINADARVKIDAAWNRLNAGEAWDVVATNTTEDALLDKSLADNWKFWQLARLDKLDSLDLALELRQLKPGGYTKPIELEEGLAIVRVNDITDGAYELSRIMVRLSIDYKIPNREAAIKSIRRQKGADFQRTILPSLREEAKIEYPLGTNFTYKIWK